MNSNNSFKICLLSPYLKYNINTVTLYKAYGKPKLNKYQDYLHTKPQPFIRKHLFIFEIQHKSLKIFCQNFEKKIIGQITSEIENRVKHCSVSTKVRKRPK